MTVGVVGLGLIGGSLAKSIHRRTGHTVLGCDINPETLSQAMLCEAVQEELTSDRLGECQVVLVALYPSLCVDYIRKNADRFADGALVVDCAGVKRGVCEQLFELARDKKWKYIGGHLLISSLYATTLSSAAIDFFAAIYTFPSMDPMLASICGGAALGLGLGLVFLKGATTGGTDIIAMIIKKYSSFNIGSALFVVDLCITACTCFVFDITTGLFSFTGLMVKSLIIDGVIERLNLCKYFTIVCDRPEPIVDFLLNDLNRSATVYEAQGAYTHAPKTIILTVLKRHQAVELRNFVKRHEPTAFITITNSSEIIGKGFGGFD